MVIKMWVTPWYHRAGWGSHFLIGVYLLGECGTGAYYDAALPAYAAHWSDVYIQSKPTEPYGLHGRSHMTYSPLRVIGFNTTFRWKHPLSQALLNVYRPVAQSRVLTPQLQARISALVATYPVKESTAIYFRGTDKHTEVERPSTQAYHDLITTTQGKVLIQSDEKAFVEEMKQTYADRVWTLPGIKTSSGTPIHLGTPSKENLYEIIIIIYVLAQCKAFAGNVSNVTHSVNLLRNDTVRYIQGPF